jgi:hypothetical protein
VTELGAVQQRLAGLWPVSAVVQDMLDGKYTWDEVLACYQDPQVVAPGLADDVKSYQNGSVHVLISSDGKVIGGRRVEHENHGPSTLFQEERKTRGARRGKRGGVGTTAPTDDAGIVAAIRATPGWTVVRGGKHYRVTGPQGERATLAVTSSDHRAAANAVKQLRAVGLDLKKKTVKKAPATRAKKLTIPAPVSDTQPTTTQEEPPAPRQRRTAMAQKIITELLDDIDGGPAVRTLTFAWEGVTYEIDLNEKNMTKIEKAMGPILVNARKVRTDKASGRKGATAAPNGHTSDPARNAAIRQWAIDNGIDVSVRGRIAQAVVDQYDAAH